MWQQCRAAYEPGIPQGSARCCLRADMLVTPRRWVDALRQHSFVAQLGVQAEGGQLPTAVALSPKKKSILQLQREYSLANLQDFLKGLLGNALVPRALEVGRPTCLHVSARQHIGGAHSVTGFGHCSQGFPLVTCNSAARLPTYGALLSLSGLCVPTAEPALQADVVSKLFLPAGLAPIGGRWGGSEPA